MLTTNLITFFTSIHSEKEDSWSKIIFIIPLLLLLLIIIIITIIFSSFSSFLFSVCENRRNPTEKKTSHKGFNVTGHQEVRGSIPVGVFTLDFKYSK